MNKVTLIKEMPDWFCLTDYDALLELNWNELYNELLIRSDAYLHPDCAEAFLCGIAHSGPIQADRRFPDAPAGPFGRREVFPSSELFPRLSKERSIRPVSTQRLKEAIVTSEDIAGNRKSDLHPYLDAFSSTEVRLRREGEVSQPQRMTVMADMSLEDTTDDELLSELAALLPRWRSELGIPEPQDRNLRMGEQVLAKIITQRSIPLLDLLIWSKHTGTDISYVVFSRVLFDDNASYYPEPHLIKKTYIPAARKLVSDEYLRKASIVIRNDSALGTRKVAEHLAIQGLQYP